MVTELEAEVGKRVRALRKMRGLSLRELAEMVGISHVYLGGMERGDRGWRLERLHAVAAALRVPLPLIQDLSIPLDRIDLIASVLDRLVHVDQARLENIAQMLEALVPDLPPELPT